MAREGLVSLFPIEELSIMGLAAVVKQLPKILRLIRETADAVIRGRARHSRDHRQSRFHPSGGEARSGPRSLDPDHRLCLALGLGVAAGPGARDARLCRSRPGACCRSSRRHIAGLRGPPCSYVGHPLTEQLGTLRPDAEEQKRRDDSAAGSAGAAGKPPQRDQAPHGGIRRDAGPAAGRGRGVRADPAHHAAFAGGGQRRA